ncbi:hypothetical protein AV926_00375 [Myroides marinus]|uniref:Copper-binding protein MbnP-like domain-containing protein n=1 Tax=Myroides marinus TaxID=703342 RepID=A0A164A9R5_9FLAO|nr:MbnP family protein [Myroides marinus]KZE83409.1 hypothetical protein AV926_00375 [Myroides marinus]
MKRILSYVALFLSTSVALTSCSTDDNNDNNKEVKEVLVGKNDVTFTFNHKMFGEELKYNTLNKANGNNEQLNVTFLKYIISNFQLTDDKGGVYTYPKDKGYFFVDSESNDFKVTLKDVPAGYYTKVKFGVGVDQEKYLRGEGDQQEFWDLCKKHDLTWGWLTGYKFINYQGTFINGTEEEAGFQLHIGSHGSKLDNYKENILVSKEEIKVSDKYAPLVDLNVEVSLLLDSTDKIVLKERPYIMVDAVRAPKIMTNATTMFSVGKVTTKQGL